ncbi:MAG: FixH family protein [Flavipsychrobacter sp.]|nr:FixH family protein [Flavipsychrobacter sp.]
MKNFNKITKTLTFALLATSIFGCKKSDNNVTTNPDPTIGYVKIASGYADGAATKVDVYAKDSAFTGYNKLYIALTDSVTNKYVENAEISLMPDMNMTTMSHSAPFENPASSQAQNMLFPCSATFIMSSMGGTWSLGVSVKNLANSKSGKAMLSLKVKDPAAARMFSFVSPLDSAKYFVGLVPGEKTIVGANDLELVVYRKVSMMSYPADSSLTISFEPTMPSMGHGSPNNVNPVHTANGHYKGKVNYTMTGTWKLAFVLSKGATVVDSTHYIDFTF